ncbi:VOC family protein [Ramlibacter pallidus]|uniref:Glyoxalase/fosfomycin resistance/dioxygenase domain-containing protein n=1 Tax=Ramlibacter pallidus TaxID=2780087 RepID=A0ABR9S0U2_9BURK|nr:VOC family protein [Ramlibacter pallidus]MBE7367131.1 hypothetical protein [Ramlibacter pallidus]
MNPRARLCPQLPVPVLETADLAASVAWYAGVLGFVVEQRVPGVVAVLRIAGGARLQLWQVPEAEPQDCCIVVEAPTCIFHCHARIASAARTWVSPTPALRAWGAWEFCVPDLHGNQLRFIQWANAGAETEPVRRQGRRA